MMMMMMMMMIIIIIMAVRTSECQIKNNPEPVTYPASKFTIKSCIKLRKSIKNKSLKILPSSMHRLAIRELKIRRRGCLRRQTWSSRLGERLPLQWRENRLKTTNSIHRLKVRA